MRKLSIEEMVNAEGNDDCGWAIAGTVIEGLAIIGVAIWCPEAFLVPKTWYGVVGLTATAIGALSASCGGGGE